MWMLLAAVGGVASMSAVTLVNKSERELNSPDPESGEGTLSNLIWIGAFVGAAALAVGIYVGIVQDRGGEIDDDSPACLYMVADVITEGVYSAAGACGAP